METQSFDTETTHRSLFGRRILKEKEMYEKEVTQTENRIQKMQDDGKDEYDVKKMVSCALCVELLLEGLE